MGFALIFQGFFSICYHVCPTNLSLQFDTTMMYLICLLCYIKIYQVYVIKRYTRNSGVYLIIFKVRENTFHIFTTVSTSRRNPECLLSIHVPGCPCADRSLGIVLHQLVGLRPFSRLLRHNDALRSLRLLLHRNRKAGQEGRVDFGKGHRLQLATRARRREKIQPCMVRAISVLIVSEQKKLRSFFLPFVAD